MHSAVTGSAKIRRTRSTTNCAAWLLLTALVAMPCGLQAKAETKAGTTTVAIHLDPASTTIRWTLKSLLHNAHGTFKLKGGEIVVNPETGLAQGEVLIDATSGTSADASHDAARDAKWQREVLESSTYPAIIFHPSKVDGLTTGDGTREVKSTGTITLHGQDHPIDLTLSVKTEGKHVNVTTHFTVPYVKWGLKPAVAGMMRYDKQVEIDVTAGGELKSQTARPASSSAPDAQ